MLLIELSALKVQVYLEFLEDPKVDLEDRPSAMIPLLWNQLPVWVQEAVATSTFKTKLKTFLFSP